MRCTVSKVVESTEKPDSSRNRAYTKAIGRLRAAHQAEFNDLLAEEYGALGLTVRRRKTAEEKALEESQRAAERVLKAAAKRQAAIEAHKAAIAALESDPLF